MNKMNQVTKQLFNDTRGANLVEYIILVGVVALIALGGFRVFGRSVQNRIQTDAAKVTNL